MTAFADHGVGGNGKPLAIVLRAGSAGSNTAADHIEATRLSLAQLPRHLLAAQRAVALGAAYHGGAGPVGFAWVRDRAGGPVQVLAAGRGLAVAADGRGVVLKVPAGGRGAAIGAGGLARALGMLPCWGTDRRGGGQLARRRELAVRAGADGQAELGGRAAGRLDGTVRLAGARRASEPCRTPGTGVRGLCGAGAAQRFDNPQAQLAVRRLQDRHTELRQAASTGLWRVHVLADARDQPAGAR
jgi:hypothetical protein